MARNGNFVANEPFRAFTAVTPSDSTVLDFEYLHVGGAGDVAIVDRVGNTVTLKGCLAGTIYPFSGTKVMSTNTTATNIMICRQ